MTRLELLHLVVGRARKNGFEFRRWYTTRLGLPWISTEAALALLESQRRYYALVFSHEFAQTFWKPGAEITFNVPGQSFQRTMPNGAVRTVSRKPYIRRSARPNAWRYHLRQMALAEEPLRYLRKYLHIPQDEVEEESSPLLKTASTKPPRPPTEETIAAKGRTSSMPHGQKPMPAGLPAFLQRPYRPASR